MRLAEPFLHIACPSSFFYKFLAAIRATSADSGCQSVCRAPPLRTVRRHGSKDGILDESTPPGERLGRILSTLFCPELLHHAGEFLCLSGLVRWYSMQYVLGVGEACQWESLPTRDTLGQPRFSLRLHPAAFASMARYIGHHVNSAPGRCYTSEAVRVRHFFYLLSRYGLRLVSSIVQFPRVNPGDGEMLLPDEDVHGTADKERACEHNAMSSTIASCSRGLAPPSIRLSSSYRSLPCPVPARLLQSGNRTKHGSLPCVPVLVLAHNLAIISFPIPTPTQYPPRDKINCHLG
jgi:hypothetical protein